MTWYRFAVVRYGALHSVMTIAAWLALASCSDNGQHADAVFDGGGSADHDYVRLGDLIPGGGAAGGRDTANPVAGDAAAIADGRQLFDWYNCSGCHAGGGGGMGPPLMDTTWIYGSRPSNIHHSIVSGRPNGMPSFGAHIPDHQVWQLVSFIQSLGGTPDEGDANDRPDRRD